MSTLRLYSFLGMLVLLPMAFGSQVKFHQQSASDQSLTLKASTSTGYFQNLLEAVDINFLYEALHVLQSNHADGTSSDASVTRATCKEYLPPATAELQLARRQDTQTAPLNSSHARVFPESTSDTVAPTPTTVVTVTKTSSVIPSSLSLTQATSIATPSTIVRPSTTVETDSQISKTSLASASSLLSSTFVQSTSQSFMTPGSAHLSATYLSSSTSLFATTITPSDGDAPTTITSLAVVGVSGNPKGTTLAISTAKPSGTLRNAGADLRAPHFFSSVAAATLISLSQVLICMLSYVRV